MTETLAEHQNASLTVLETLTDGIVQVEPLLPPQIVSLNAGMESGLELRPATME